MNYLKALSWLVLISFTSHVAFAAAPDESTVIEKSVADTAKKYDDFKDWKSLKDKNLTKASGPLGHIKKPVLTVKGRVLDVEVSKSRHVTIEPVSVIGRKFRINGKEVTFKSLDAEHLLPVVTELMHAPRGKKAGWNDWLIPTAYADTDPSEQLEMIGGAIVVVALIMTIGSFAYINYKMNQPSNAPVPVPQVPMPF